MIVSGSEVWITFRIPMLMDLEDNSAEVMVVIWMTRVVDVLIDARNEITPHTVEDSFVLLQHQLLIEPLEERSVDVAELDGIHCRWIIGVFASVLSLAVELSLHHSPETISHVRSPQEEHAIHVHFILLESINGDRRTVLNLTAFQAQLELVDFILLFLDGEQGLLGVFWLNDDLHLRLH